MNDLDSFFLEKRICHQLSKIAAKCVRTIFNIRNQCNFDKIAYLCYFLMSYLTLIEEGCDGISTFFVSFWNGLSSKIILSALGILDVLWNCVFALPFIESDIEYFFKRKSNSFFSLVVFPWICCSRDMENSQKFY